MQDKIVKVTGFIRKIEKYFLVIVLSLMIGLSCLQIFLRTFFKAITWFDMFLNYSVLWAAMIAAGIVTYETSHIKIDLVGRFTKGKIKESVYTFTSFFAGMVSTILMIIFLVYILVVEYFSKTGSSGPASQKWLLLMILPVGFLIIAVRFFNQMLTYNYDLTGKRVMGVINAVLSILIPSVIVVGVFVLLYGNKAMLQAVLYLGEVKILYMIITISIIVSVTAIISLINSIFWKKPRLTYYLSSVPGLYYTVLFFYFIIQFIDLNIRSKLNNEMILFSNSQLNFLYGIPALLFFLAHYSLFYPFSNYLLKVYPRPDHESEVEGV
ncbi:MAG: hypothetical protein A2015_13390 [Spirochaetes bacterium GWF1_31_7]|nr:MAG: hypothetical protein A2Y30_11435 [Spirochaetes bacterium GWE1_32_154]OHD49816.1 MAG: hypothetical protein A2015_13390 [Spirochaetes bacterium GWF1_31_7]OHD52779.1 MAG: hypothetical protein A2Y29_15635 [Spirochaetes bacterium GWE2_31_10]OHD82562.1 MAG: hypothetical protein A2355_12805 [Spirochaetes bacterium RIFOXYB1_FULL_32_8]HBD92939.1 hypothetical protein [Spirochaetia bacterium]